MTEARFLHSQKIAKAVELGAQIEEIWDNGQTGDQKIVLVEFSNSNGTFVIDNADVQWADHGLSEAVERLQAGDIELNPVEEFRKDGDAIISLNSVQTYEFFNPSNRNPAGELLSPSWATT
jgi:hypothetical protein